jgi:3-hydroxymyristoyl/3-hydroxydecanoyl-(acyl carrier protein) dehydratase
LSALGKTKAMDQRIEKLIEFNILEKSKDSIRTELTIDERMPSFEGHFPGNPILPAVSIVDISLLLLSRVQPHVSFANIQVKRSKFMSMVRPNQKVEITASCEDGHNWRLNWRAKDNQSKLAQVHLVL